MQKIIFTALALLAFTSACKKETLPAPGSCFNNSYTVADTNWLLSKSDAEIRGIALTGGIGKCTVDAHAFDHHLTGCKEAIVYNCDQLQEGNCEIEEHIYLGVLRGLISSGRCFQ